MKPLPNSMPFKAQLDSFKVWCQQPFNFGASGSSGVVDSTYRGIENTVSKFIGVAYLIEMIEMPLLSFHLFSNQALVARYLGLMRHRCDTNHMLAEVTRLIKVVKYLQDSASAANSDASQANVRHCDDMIAWLLRIQKQLRRHPTLKAPPPRAAPPPPPDSDDDMAQAAPASPIGTAAPTGPPSRMQPPARAAPDAAAAAAEAAAAGVTAQGRETLEPMVPVDGEEDMPAELPSKSTLLAFSTDLLQRAEERIQRDLSIGDVVGYDTARLAGDALLVAFLSGLYIPPLRLGVIRTLTVPGEPCCLSRQCVRTGCRGNSLRLTSHRQPTPSSAQQAGAVQSITVELFHHKTERYTPTATVFTLPRSLAAATKNYLEHARPVLLNYSTAEEQPPTLFVSPNGFPYDENSITVGNSWTRIQRLYRAPWTPFPARVFRHIHSTSAWGDVVREVAAMQGPLAGDARIMGNSIRTWETHYIRDRETMLGQAAISRLASWRRQQRQQQTDTPPSEPPVTAQNMAARRDQSEQLSEDEAPSQPPAPRVAAARAAAAAAEVGAPASEDVVTEGATAGVAAAEEAAATVAAPPPSSPPPPPPPPANEEHPQPPPPRPPPPPPPPQPPAHNMLAEEAGPSAGSVEQEGGRVFALRPPMQRQGEGNGRARADGRDGWMPPSEVPPARRRGFPASARGMGALETPRVEYGRVAVGRHRDGDTKAGTYAGFPTTFSRADSIAAATPRITTPANVTPANVDAPVRFSNAGGRSTVRTPAATKPWVGSPVFASGSRRYQPAAEAGGQAGMGVDGSGFPWAKRRRLCPFVDDEAEVARGPDWEEDVSESEGGEGDSQFQGGSMEGRQAFDSEDGGSRRFQASGWLTAGPNGRMGGEEESDYSSEGAARHGGVRPAEYRGVSAPHEGPYRGRTSNEAPTVYDEDDMWFD
ncbi:hypothetical protein PLESTB_001958700 [Pleodorina starrii]|uniref:Uncharacterized protein n=1 Tax=Pleodorina starrii TaxID=330485 RepID=A0A9W6FBV7_9CHLO|nr:hypothetical protein PLESTB_001958700 [Pleodorina starrii]